MRKTKSRERIRILSLVVVLLLLPTMMFAIPESGKKVTLNLESVTVKDFFDALRQQTGLSFVYNTEQTKSLKPMSLIITQLHFCPFPTANFIKCLIMF